MSLPSDSGRESASQRPLWAPVVEGHVMVARLGLKAPRAVMAAGSALVRKLLVEGQVPDMGVLQGYLYVGRSFLQLAAAPFDPAEWAPEPIGSLHPVTDEPMGHWLVMTYGSDTSPWGKQLAQIRQDHERNVELLRTDTGFPVFDTIEDPIVFRGPS